MKKTRTVILFLLLLAMLLSVTAFASTPSSTNLHPASNGTLYWIHDPALFESFLLHQTSVSEIQNLSTYTLSADTRSNSLYSISAPVNYTYTFDVDGSGPAEAITVTGNMEEVTLGGLTFQTGILKGEATIKNNISCKVSAVIHMEVGGPRVSAGITLVPETALSLDDYIFFAIGTPFITSDMLPNQITSTDDPQTCQFDVLPTNTSAHTSSTNSTNYVSKITHFSSFSANNYDITGLSQRLSVHTDSYYNRVCLSVKSYTTTIEQHFSDSFYVQATVDDLKIGLRSDPLQGPSIEGFHTLPEQTNDASTFVDDDFISNMTTLLGDLFEINSSYFIPFQALFNSLKPGGKLTLTTYTTGVHSYALFDFTINPILMTDVTFDDVPLPVEFSIDHRGETSGYFTPYSEISYYVTFKATEDSTITSLSIEGAPINVGAFQMALRVW